MPELSTSLVTPNLNILSKLKYSGTSDNVWPTPQLVFNTTDYSATLIQQLGETIL